MRKIIINESQKKLWDINSIIYLSIFTIISLIISVPLIYFNSIRLDEAQSIWQVSHSIPEILDIVGRDVHVPLY
jgi:hypothetical protein